MIIDIKQIQNSFLFICFFYLLLNTIRDIKTNKIDERMNYAIFGSLLMLIASMKIGLLSFVYFFIASFITGFFAKFTKKGDFMPIFTLTTAFFVISFHKAVFWIIFLFIFSSFFVFLMKKNQIKKMPFYPVILISYTLTCFM